MTVEKLTNQQTVYKLKPIKHILLKKLLWQNYESK